MTGHLTLSETNDPAPPRVQLPEDESAARRDEVAAAAKLNQLGTRTARWRNRKGHKMIRAEKYARDSRVRTDVVRRAVGDAEVAVEVATTRLHGPIDRPPHQDDRDRRGLGNVTYGMVLTVLAVISVPIAYQVLEVLEEPMNLTLLLALLLDVVFLFAAHFAGVIAKKSHLSADARMTLGPEYYIGLLLGVLGILLALAQGGVRWWYLQETGEGNVLGIVFSTILILVTYVVAVICSYLHHHARVSDLEKAERRLRRAHWRQARADKRINQARKRLRVAHEGRRHLGEINVNRADRIIHHFERSALSRGFAILVTDPVWLTHERLLAAPQPGAMLQPVDVNLADQLPALSAARNGDATNPGAAA